MNILLLSPPTPDTFWSFRHVLPFVSKRAAFPPLGLLTVAALLPKDWNLRLADMNVETLRDEDIQWADYVFLSAMLVHKSAIPSIIQRCQKFQTPIVAGGPLFTASPNLFPEIQHRVLGEAEEILPALVQDLQNHSPQPQYQPASRPPMSAVPIPRWDLVNLKHYATMAVQFSRGCPYDCEFCDIIVMNGRIPRTKAPNQLLAELETLQNAGWRDMVFIVDDNFIGNRNHTKTLLRALIQWRQQTRSPLGFLTEASVNLADDPELCSLMVQAGFKKVFVGIETPSLESLQECRKLLNRGRNLIRAVQTLQQAGLEVMGGFIVGFDHDPQDIFKRQFEFIQHSGVVTAMVGLLTALPQTRLYQRLMREGRLENESTGNNTDAALNFKPILDREFLQNGYRELMRRLYEPKNYAQRIRTFLKQHQPTGPKLGLSTADIKAFIKSLWLLGVWHRGRRAYWQTMLSTLLTRPKQFPHAVELLIIGYHFRRMSLAL